MKKQTLALLLSCLSLSTFGQTDFESALLGEQVNPSSGSSASGSSVEFSETISGVEDSACEENGQSSVPVSMLMALLHEKGSSFDIQHEPKTGKLFLEIPKMKANCNDMILWTVSKNENLSDDVEYYIEARFKEADSFKIYDKNFDTKFTKKYEPNYKGFEKCLHESNILGEPAVQSERIIKLSDNIDQTGTVYLASNGPKGSTLGKHPNVGCMKVSAFDKEGKGKSVLSYTSHRDSQEYKNAKLICNKKDYKEINKHIDDFSKYKDILIEARNSLLLKEYEEVADKLKTTGEITESDKEVIEDFQKYIFDPKLKEIESKYVTFKNATGEDQRKKKERLEKAQRELLKYVSSPYITKDSQKNLQKAGNFSSALRVQKIAITAKHFNRVGVVYDDKYRTPDQARVYSDMDVKKLEEMQPTIMRDHDILNCRIVGTSASIYEKEDFRRDQIDERTENYRQIVEEEIAEMNKKCNRYYVNKKKCFNRYAENIGNLKRELKAANDVDHSLAEKYAKEADRIALVEEKAKKRCKDKLVYDDDDSYLDDDEDSPSTTPSFSFEWKAEDDQPYNLDLMNSQQMAGFQGMQQPQGFNYPASSFNNISALNQTNPLNGMPNTGFGSGHLSPGFSFGSFNQTPQLSNFYGPTNQYRQPFGAPNYGTQSYFGQPSGNSFTFGGNQGFNPNQGLNFGPPNPFRSPAGGSGFYFGP